MLKRLKGFRTYIFAVLLVADPLIEAALTGDADVDRLLRQLLIAAVLVALRSVTNTAPGKAE